MSASDIKLVKAAVAAFADQPANVQVTPSGLAKRIAKETGLDFGPTTIAKYLKAHGWVKVEQAPPLPPIIYRRPTTGE